MKNILLGLDLFGKPMPTFNLKGNTEKNTLVGSLSSIIIMTLTFLFGLLKLEHLSLKKNPSITTNDSHVDEGEEYSLS